MPGGGRPGHSYEEVGPHDFARTSGNPDGARGNPGAVLLLVWTPNPVDHERHDCGIVRASRVAGGAEFPESDPSRSFVSFTAASRF